MANTNRSQKRPVRPLLIAAVAAVLLFGSVAAAILLDTSAAVKNTFIKAQVGSAVQETFADGLKKDVKIENTGTVPAVIRAAVVINWLDADGNILAQPAAGDVTDPANLADAIGSDWQKIGNYYYYKGFVGNGKATTALITSIKAASTAAHQLKIDIVAEAIQATPATAAQEAWGALFDGSGWTKASTTGTP